MQIVRRGLENEHIIRRRHSGSLFYEELPGIRTKAIIEDVWFSIRVNAIIDFIFLTTHQNIIGYKEGIFQRPGVKHEAFLVILLARRYTC